MNLVTKIIQNLNGLLKHFVSVILRIKFSIPDIIEARLASGNKSTTASSTSSSSGTDYVFSSCIVISQRSSKTSINLQFIVAILQHLLYEEGKGVIVIFFCFGQFENMPFFCLEF